MQSRAKTTGITETEFVQEELTKYRLIEVGQQSERKRWIHCFQDVAAVFFCVALDEYDLKSHEDETASRIQDSLKFFDEICNGKWFLNVSIVLFFTKSDLFREKIEKLDLKESFPEYDGGLDFEKGTTFIQQKFKSLNHNHGQKQIYSYMSCYTDTKNLKYVFDAVREIVVHKLLDAQELD